MKKLTRFLGTFDDNQNPPGQNQNPAAGAPPATEQPVLIPVSAVTEILRAGRPESEIRQEAENARRAAVNSQQPPAPQSPPQQRRRRRVEETENEESELSQQVQELGNQVNILTESLRQAHLDTYRAQAIANAIQTGRPVIEAMVQGNTPEAINASIAVAQAEYEMLQNRIRADLEAQLRAAGQLPAAGQQPAQGQQSQQQVPQGTVTQTQPGANAQLQAEQPPAPQAGPSVPTYILSVNAPGQQPQGLSPEDLAYLTSSEAIRNGDYARYRHLIQGALRTQAGHSPPKGWSFTPNGSQIAPPVPPTAPASAMQHSIYAGATFPQANPGYQRGAPPQQGFENRSYVQPPQGGYPQQPNYGPPGAPAPYGQQNFGRPPQPMDLENGAPLDPSAASAAAGAAINRMRMRASTQPPTH